ncbi:hypothetical protein WK91_18280 [Burkholderia cepacia]|uniref:phage baseplate assembly protein V n=1 Tax=Burkholderia cepacia TaxID=292 RepID=UPI000759D7FA|nr:phage baseplate assembly protein V [Burkholderia cepacia]KVW15385.1 hypothetical protein WK91_18280 [Burkholderia cepacia]
MSIDALLNTIRAHSQMAQGEKTGTRVGEITAYDPNKHAVKVKMWPDTQESLGWIPLASPWIGNGWGLVGGPSIGDQVKIAFDREDQDAGVVVGRMFNDIDQPPAVPSGELWLVHKLGAFVKLTNDGKLLLNGDTEIDLTGPTVNITTTGATNINAQTANVTATASASVTAPAINLGASGQSLLSFVTSAFMSLFNGHTHPDPQGGNTSAPNQQMTSSHLTTTVKGG